MRTLLFLAPLLAAPAARAQCPSWSTEFVNPVVQGPVYASASLDGGAHVAIGGDFLKAGGFTANSVALWDGTSLQPLGAGFDGPVHALAFFDAGSGPELYAGGEFTQSGGELRPGVARWDGAQWAAVGSGIPGIVRALHAWNGSLWVGGEFASAGGAPASNVARWDGSAWSAVGGGTAGTVEAIHDYANQLVVGGSFLSASGVAARNIARWTGTSWAIVGNGTNGRVVALLRRDEGPVSRLYVGGTFMTAGGFPAPYLASWDGSAWASAGAALDGPVRALLDHQAPGDVGPRLYVGGSFSEADGEPALRVAAWDGAQWSGVGSGLSGTAVETLVGDASGRVLAGGDCMLAVDGGELNLVVWNGTEWDPLGQGASPDFAQDLGWADDGTGGAVWIGGLFEQAGGVATRGVARWDGERWERPGDFEAGDADDFVTYDEGAGPRAFAIGSYFEFGGAQTVGIARFDGAVWSSVGGGLQNSGFVGRVFDAGTGPELYVGGIFLSAGGVAGRALARWDGSAWSDVAGGLSGTGRGTFGPTTVRAMTVWDDGGGPALYVGGNFSAAGGVPCLNVARWDGSSFTPLGAGLAIPPTIQAPSVLALEVYDDGSGPTLYAGGYFNESGGQPVDRFARWDGVAWTPVGGTGSSVPVFDLEVFDDGSGSGPLLLAGIDGGIASWDGTAHGVFAGTVGNEKVNSLLALPAEGGATPRLWAIGNFRSLGGVPASLVARLDACGVVGTAFCTGDGSGTPCPCGNAGLPGHGCASSIDADGARLGAVGTASVSADTLELRCSGTSSSFVTYFQGTVRVAGGAGAVFGDGLRCAGGTTIRLRTLLAVEGASSYPEPGDLPVSVRGEVPPGGGTRTYQAWFRNAMEFCTPSTFNLSNGLEIVWTP